MSKTIHLPRNRAEHKTIIYYDSPKLEKYINDWMKEAECDSEERFIHYLEQAGVKSTRNFTNYNSKNNSFRCVNASLEEYIIVLNFRDSYYTYPTISVTKADTTEKYELDFDDLDQSNMPIIKLVSRQITRTPKVLECVFNKVSCERILKIGSNQIIKIYIQEPNIPLEFITNEVMCHRNSLEIEEYLLNIYLTHDTEQIYEKIIEFLEFSSKDIKNSKKILISYSEKIEEIFVERSKVLIANGKMQEYAIFEDGETFHVFNNGNWKYVSEVVHIDFNAKLQRYVFGIRGPENIIFNINQIEIMGSVKKRIAKLWHKVK